MGRWITKNGKHIYLTDENEQLKNSKSIFKTTKEKQIEANKKEADRLNNQNVNRATNETQRQHRQAVKELNDSKYEDGTYDISTKTTKEFDRGYQVTFCQIGDDYTDEEYAKKVNECLDMSSDRKTYAGKFEGTPEISFHWNDKEAAIKYATENNQKSIWDWEKCEQILTGGTGERKRR